MNNFDARMVYENSKLALIKAFPDVDPEKLMATVKLTQGALRFEQPLVTTSNAYNFPVLVNEAVFSNMEDRLRLQDSFIVSQIGIFLGAPASIADNAFLPDSYPSPVKYGANAAPANAFYNSNLQITVNNDIILPKWDVMRHLNAPETQQTAALGAGSPQDQWRGAFDGFYPVEPNLVLIGSKSTQLQIFLKGAALSAVLANSRAIIIVRGVLAQNSTVVS